LSELCKWLHDQLERLPTFVFPFEPNGLPENGIYFFYEKGQCWAHSSTKPRIVRVGTHRDGNFQARIAEHFLLNDRKMTFSRDQSPPHDCSIFRKNRLWLVKHLKAAPISSAQPGLVINAVDKTIAALGAPRAVRRS
jgi:hypothetical protein